MALGGIEIYNALKPSARHAPALFNLGAKGFDKLFHDGRVERQTDGSITTGSDVPLPDGVESVLAAQALFPAIAKDELAGALGTDGKPIPLHTGSGAWAAEGSTEAPC